MLCPKISLHLEYGGLNMEKKFKEDEEKIEKIIDENTTAASRRETIEDIEKKEREEIRKQDKS